MAKKATVICSAPHPVDLHDGRVLAPGETAEGIDTEHPHQRALVLDGSLHVVDGMTPKKRKSDDLVALAAKADDSTNTVKE